jgi:8-oxo-dGTP diphosphatase/A/G-specific adenine glycosylase
MEKRINGRAIIIDGEDVLLMFRRKIKNGQIKEYYAIPGGGLEENETIEECVKREIQEEFNIEVEVKEQLGVVEDDKNIGYIFKCSIISGTPILGGEELENNSEENYYEVRKLKVSEIDKYDILEENKELIRKAYNNK